MNMVALVDQRPRVLNLKDFPSSSSRIAASGYRRTQFPAAPGPRPRPLSSKASPWRWRTSTRSSS